MSKSTNTAPKPASNAKSFVEMPFSDAGSGAYKAGPQAPRDMGKSRNAAGFANGGMYQAGKPAARNGGKSGAPC